MKNLVLLLCFGFLLAGIGCGKKETPAKGGGKGNTSGWGITNVHAPTSGSDSVYFTADSSHLGVLLFCPLGGNNHVVIHDWTTNTDIYNDVVSTNDTTTTNFTAGDNYSIRCYSGQGGLQSNFLHVSSSYKNSGSSPNPFAGYTQYYNNSNAQGPSDGVVIIIKEEAVSQSVKPR